MTVPGEGRDEMAQSGSSARESANNEVGGSPLRAQVAIEPHPDSHCAVVDAGEDAKAVTHHVKTGNSTSIGGESSCGECHTEMDFGPDADRGRTYLKSAVSTRCICPVFEEHDCIPSVKAVRSGSIVVVLSIPHREVLREIIADLRTVGATVSVEWLVDGTETDATAEIDVSSITDKQREAMERAREMGYYDTPRRADLSEVAAALDISESAVSQRLNAAETKLVKAFIGE